MSKEKPKPSRSGRRGDPISLAPLTPEQAIKGIFAISKEDVKRIAHEAKPAAKKKFKPKG